MNRIYMMEYPSFLIFIFLCVFLCFSDFCLFVFGLKHEVINYLLKYYIDDKYNVTLHFRKKTSHGQCFVGSVQSAMSIYHGM